MKTELLKDTPKFTDEDLKGAVLSSITRDPDNIIGISIRLTDGRYVYIKSSEYMVDAEQWLVFF